MFGMITTLIGLIAPIVNKVLPDNDKSKELDAQIRMKELEVDEALAANPNVIISGSVAWKRYLKPLAFILIAGVMAYGVVNKVDIAPYVAAISSVLPALN